jgi:uncharacterized protein YceK
MRRLVVAGTLLLASLVVLLQGYGCMSIGSLVTENYRSEIYGGTTTNLEAQGLFLGGCAPVPAFIWVPILIVDLPFSLVADTALLPVTICMEYMKGVREVEVESEAPVEPESKEETDHAPISSK